MAEQTAYELDRILNDENHSVRLRTQKGTIDGQPLTLTAIHVGDTITLGTGVKYTDANPVFAKATGALDFLAGSFTRGVAAKVIAKKFGTTLSATTFKNRLSTQLKWQETVNPTLSLPLIFVATNDSQSQVIEPIRTLLYAVFPTRHNLQNPFNPGGKGLDTGLYNAPLNYSGGRDDRGLWNVKIGKWFEMPNAVITDVQPSFSATPGPDGLPIIGQATVNFTYFEVPTIDEVNNWFL
jgi:hypothetical protein